MISSKRTRRWLWVGLVGAIALHILGPSSGNLPEVVASSTPVPRAGATAVAQPTEPHDTHQAHLGPPPTVALQPRASLYPPPSAEFRDLLPDEGSSQRMDATSARRAYAPVAPSSSAAAFASSAIGSAAPYTFSGRVIDAVGVRAILNRSERTYAAAVGDVLDEEYRLDAVDAQQARITHLATGSVYVVHAAGTPR